MNSTKVQLVYFPIFVFIFYFEGSFNGVFSVHAFSTRPSPSSSLFHHQISSLQQNNWDSLSFLRKSGAKRYPFSKSSSKLYEKWGPRWSPRPDSDFYNDGDDIDIYGGRIYSGRSSQRGVRRRRTPFIPKFYKKSNGLFTIQRFLVFCNIVCFIFQVYSAIEYIPIFNQVLARSSTRYGEVIEDPFTAGEVVEQMLVGRKPMVISERLPTPIMSGTKNPSTILNRLLGKTFIQSPSSLWGPSIALASTIGPFTMDFVHQRSLTRLQPHRYLTAGFLHGSLLHLLVNMRALWSMPRWVENYGGSGGGKVGGWCLYITTYLMSIIAGNIAQDYTTSIGKGLISLSLGSSGGICGLNGLMFMMLRRMNHRGASLRVFKNMIFLLIFGTLVDGISNAAHIGGFLCGVTMGYLFGPTYDRRYIRKSDQILSETDSVTNDEMGSPSMDYRRLMGPGKGPNWGGIRLRNFWIFVGLAIWSRPVLQSALGCIVMGFQNPGRLSGMVTSSVLAANVD